MHALEGDREARRTRVAHGARDLGDAAEGATEQLPRPPHTRLPDIGADAFARFLPKGGAKARAACEQVMRKAVDRERIAEMEGYGRRAARTRRVCASVPASCSARSRSSCQAATLHAMRSTHRAAAQLRSFHQRADSCRVALYRARWPNRLDTLLRRFP